MVINVSEALDADTSEIITVERNTRTFNNGIAIPGIPTTFKTVASVQQPTPEDLQFLPEGERTKDLRKFISKKPLFSAREGADGIADILIYKGVRFKVVTLADWNSYGHSTAFGAREQ